mmetsp:Transcript_6553/g.14307  ORF Transcript_6553/g.14307 Transcript_6553/m.14307 type:complete len:214 (-) Transcript_6553:126-767(-)
MLPLCPRGNGGGDVGGVRAEGAQHEAEVPARGVQRVQRLEEGWQDEIVLAVAREARVDLVAGGQAKGALELLKERPVHGSGRVGVSEDLCVGLLELRVLVERDTALRPIKERQQRRRLPILSSTNLGERRAVPPLELAEVILGESVRGGAALCADESGLADDLIETVFEAVAARRVAHHDGLVDVEVKDELRSCIRWCSVYRRWKDRRGCGRD